MGSDECGLNHTDDVTPLKYPYYPLQDWQYPHFEIVYSVKGKKGYFHDYVWGTEHRPTLDARVKDIEKNVGHTVVKKYLHRKPKEA